MDISKLARDLAIFRPTLKPNFEAGGKHTKLYEGAFLVGIVVTSFVVALLILVISFNIVNIYHAPFLFLSFFFFFEFLVSSLCI